MFKGLIQNLLKVLKKCFLFFLRLINFAWFSLVKVELFSL